MNPEQEKFETDPGKTSSAMEAEGTDNKMFYLWNWIRNLGWTDVWAVREGKWHTVSMLSISDPFIHAGFGAVLSIHSQLCQPDHLKIKGLNCLGLD